VKKRRQEWWECPNHFCGAQILFRMVGPTPTRIDPTCFCGSTMLRVALTRGQRSGSSEHGRTNRDTTRRRDYGSIPSPGKRPALQFGRQIGAVEKNEIGREFWKCSDKPE